MRSFPMFLVLLAAPALPGPLVLQLDPSQTHVDFTLADVLHTVHGRFRLKNGSIRFDPETGAAEGILVVDAKSGESGSNARDSRMHKNILESEKYPEITFVPDHVTGKVNPQGPSQVQLHGMFTIHGSAHEITLPVQAEIAGEQMNANTRFPVPYAKWGMKNPSTFLLRVSDTVQIEIHAAGHVSPGS